MSLQYQKVLLLEPALCTERSPTGKRCLSTLPCGVHSEAGLRVRRCAEEAPARPWRNGSRAILEWGILRHRVSWEHCWDRLVLCIAWIVLFARRKPAIGLPFSVSSPAGIFFYGRWRDPAAMCVCAFGSVRGETSNNAKDRPTDGVYVDVQLYNPGMGRLQRDRGYCITITLKHHVVPVLPMGCKAG